MTREEVAKILETGCAMPDYPHSAQMLDEALRMGAAALRAQQTHAKLDRSRWEGCEYCADHKYNVQNCPMLSHDEDDCDRGMYIYDGSLISNSGEFQEAKINFCPICGRPLTEEAWAELERRISDGRLTVKLNDGTWALERNADESSIPLAIGRLAAYEGAGLDPKEVEVQSIALAQCKPYIDAICDEHGKVFINPIRLAELVQSEKDGRLVVLTDNKPTSAAMEEARYLLGVLKTELERGVMTNVKVADRIAELFREGAEAALKKREEADNEAD